MSHFSLKMMFPLLVVALVFLVGGVFFAATGLVTPLADAAATSHSADTLAAEPITRQPRPVVSPAEAEAIAAGNMLFAGNCAQCHALHEVVVGPALAGITKRRPVGWLLPWIKNSGKVVASGDAYAVKIYNQYQQQQMPSFQLTDPEIRQILAYLQAESGSGMANAPALALK